MQIDNQIASHRWRLRRANSYHIPDGTADIRRIGSGPLRAISRLMQCSKQVTYSITSSARPNSVIGKVRPSALAVLRLMTNSVFVDC